MDDAKDQGGPDTAPGAVGLRAGGGPSVGVVIATYNCADCILTAVASIREQTLPGARIIVVDDASTDETASLLAPLAARGELTYLRVSHRGSGGARNAGIRATDDELIAFLDADDTFEPDALRVMVAALQAAPGAGFCITDVARVYPDRTEVRSGRPPEGDLLLALLRENFVQGNNLFRRQALLDAGLFDESFLKLEDWELYIRLLARGIRPVYVEGAWYRYVMRGGSLTRDLSGIVEAKRQLLRKHHKRMADEGVPGLRAIYADQLWWMARMYFGPLRRRGAALRCLLEGVRYDPAPGRILRTIRTRLRGPHG
jgi:glycosyltransferase involved in cell wall biosynthesis